MNKTGFAQLLMVAGIVTVLVLATIVVFPMIQDGLTIMAFNAKNRPDVTVSDDECEVVIGLRESKSEMVWEAELRSSYNVDFYFRGEKKRETDYDCVATKCVIDKIGCEPRNEGTPQSCIDWAAQNPTAEATCTGYYKATRFDNYLTNTCWKHCGGRFTVEWTCTYKGDECRAADPEQVKEPDPELIGGPDDDQSVDNGDDASQGLGEADDSGAEQTKEEGWLIRFIDWVKGWFA